MVEFQHNGIVFAAIYTGMTFQVGDDICYQFFRPHLSLLLYMGSMIRFMSFIPIVLNLFYALPAMHLQPIRHRFLPKADLLFICRQVGHHFIV